MRGPAKSARTATQRALPVMHMVGRAAVARTRAIMAAMRKRTTDRGNMGIRGSLRAATRRANMPATKAAIAGLPSAPAASTKGQVAVMVATAVRTVVVTVRAVTAVEHKAATDQVRAMVGRAVADTAVAGRVAVDQGAPATAMAVAAPATGTVNDRRPLRRDPLGHGAVAGDASNSLDWLGARRRNGRRHTVARG